MGKVLEIRNLNKRYGRIHAVDDLSLDVSEGEVFGILGPNGSGKTTTLGIVLDVINANSGEYLWFDKAPDKDEVDLGTDPNDPNDFPTGVFGNGCSTIQPRDLSPLLLFILFLYRRRTNDSLGVRVQQ